MATKAKTKAQRRRDKGNVGRPRKEGPREPNGRLSRSGRSHEPIDKLAIEARARIMGLPKGEEKNQKAGSYIGYLSLIGRADGISEEQYEAAQAFLKLYNNYQHSIKGPGAIYEARTTIAASDDPEAYAHWCKGVQADYEALRKRIQEAQNETRENLWAALDIIILRNEKHAHLIGATRILCNVFARYFRVSR